jgi:hypothetical protein
MHFELILIQGDRHGSSFSFLQVDNHLFQQHLLKRLHFSIICFWCLCQKGGCSCVDLYLCPLFCSTGLHIYFLYQYHAIFIAMDLLYSLRLGIVILPALLFLLSIALVIHGLLCVSK